MDNQTPAAPDAAQEAADATEAKANRPSIVVARRNGLSHVAGQRIPDLPMRDLTGAEVARLIPDRDTLLSIVAAGAYTFIPDAPKAAPSPEQPTAETPSPSAEVPEQAPPPTDSGDAQPQEVEDPSHGG